MRYAASTPFSDTFLLAGGYDEVDRMFLQSVLVYDYDNEVRDVVVLVSK